ncbi:MAG TPA: FkbM family methyltransferase [Candidatus Acidoferrales bacterium]|jgi:FkbM family methyltransferase
MAETVSNSTVFEAQSEDSLSARKGMPGKAIFDVGMHQGEDTEFYLRRGFAVLGVEANPFLVAALKKKFRPYLESGQLRIVDKAINSKPGKARFSINTENSVWGTLSDAFADRNSRGGFASEEIEVDCITFDELLQKYGVPYYLKIDIEGCDILCVQALRGVSTRPKYISIESSATSPGCGFRDVLAELALLRELGYSHFKYVDQAQIPGSERRLVREGPAVTYKFPPDSSGPFGNETPGKWLGFGTAGAYGLALRTVDDFCGHSGRFYGRTAVWRLRALRERLTGRPDHWYDLHAKLE